MKVRLALLLVVLALCCTSVLANDFEAYPFELQDELRAKFVFVGFPGNAAGDTLFEDIHSGIVETIRTYLASHSNGNLTLTDDSGILFKYDEDFGGAEAPLAWEALMPASSYITDAAFDENYEFYDELNGWWIEPETPGHCTQLFAEILWRIYQDYEGNGANPFPAGDGTPWTLFFIFMSESDSSPDGWPGGPWDAGVGGRPSVKVDPVAANASTFGFFANLKQNEAGTRFAGSGQNGWNFLRGYDGTPGGDPVDESFAAEGNARGILHEFVHTMGISDGPPNLHNLPYSEETYYYGYLNLICQHFDGGAGIPPVGDPHLLGIPWNRGRDSNESACYVDITDQNVRGLKI